MSKLELKHYRYQSCYPFLSGNKSIELIEFDTLRETDCGYWIRESLYLSDKERFVLKQSNKRYAYPTKKEAFNSFRIRTLRSYQHSVKSVKNAADFIDLVNLHELCEKPINLNFLKNKDFDELSNTF